MIKTSSSLIVNNGLFNHNTIEEQTIRTKETPILHAIIIVNYVILHVHTLIYHIHHVNFVSSVVFIALIP